MSAALDRFAKFVFHQTIRLTYGRIEVEGRERIPATGPVILVANHPNSVADACLVAGELTPRRVGFIAKDTLTRAPLLGPLVRAAGVIGVARPMDYRGDEERARERNRLAVEACVPRLLAGEVIAIFPEGVSTDARHLLPIRRGAIRFGYAAESAAGFSLGVVWIPVGISYTAKQRFRSDVFVRIGAPFGLRDVAGDPAHLPEAEVLERGVEHLQRALSALVVSLERDDLAPLLDRITALLADPDAAPSARVETQRRAARALERLARTDPGGLARLDAAVRGYDARLREASLRDATVRRVQPAEDVRRHARATLTHGALLLLNRYGWINSLAPRWIAYSVGGLGRRIETVRPEGRTPRAPLVEQVAWSTYGGWIGVGVAFPIQIALVFALFARAGNAWTGAVAASIYAATLVPSWRLYIRRRDLTERHWRRTREAFAALLHRRALPALMVERARLTAGLAALLADDDRSTS